MLVAFAAVAVFLDKQPTACTHWRACGYLQHADNYTSTTDRSHSLIALRACVTARADHALWSTRSYGLFLARALLVAFGISQLPVLCSFTYVLWPLRIGYNPTIAQSPDEWKEAQLGHGRYSHCKRHWLTLSTRHWSIASGFAFEALSVLLLLSL